MKQCLIVVDPSFMSYQVDVAQALANAGRLMQEGGAHSVKLEGGEKIASTVARIVEAGILVMGHIGLTPQCRFMDWAVIESKAYSGSKQSN